MSEAGGDCVKVIARFRPTNEMEKQQATEQQLKITFEDQNKTVIFDSPTQTTALHRFNYDRVFDWNSKQAEVYDVVGKDLVNEVLNGYNGTIFTYGQTGSGKTFTMMGPDGSLFNDDLRGVIPRAVQQVFAAMPKTEGSVFTVKCSYLEIYLEHVYDLLIDSDDPPVLKVHDTPSRGVWVEALTEEFASDDKDVYDLLMLGGQHRTVSSRSHAVFIVFFEQRDATGETKKGKLNLVDLAGSEKVGKTEAAGKLLEEAKKINLSLSTLANCIHALTEKNVKHVPYRDSKLTHLLKDSLGGNSKTTLVITCSPSPFNLAETISTCQFGERAKTIKTKPKQNKLLSAEQLQKLVEKLTAEIAALKKYAAGLEKTIEWMKSPQYQPGKPPPFKVDSLNSLMENVSAVGEEVVDADLPEAISSQPSAATDIIALAQARADIQKLKEEHQIVIEDLQESVKFLKEQLDETTKQMEDANQFVKTSQSKQETMVREVEAERSKSALASKQFSYQIEQQKAETAALQQTVQTLTQKYTETANSAKRIQGELETKVVQAKQEICAIEKRTQEDVEKVLEELNQSEERAAALTEKLNSAGAMLQKAEIDAAKSAEAVQLAQRKLEVRMEENSALRKQGKMTPPELDAAIARVEKQLELASQNHLATVQKITQEKHAAVSALQKQLTSAQEECNLLKQQQHQAEAEAAAFKTMKAQLATSANGASGDEAAKLRAEVLTLSEKLQAEIATRLVLEPQVKQLQLQSKELQELGDTIMKMAEEDAIQKEKIAQQSNEILFLKNELDELKQSYATLQAEKERMLMRPSNRMFRPANYRSVLREAYENGQLVNIAELPGQLKTTNSMILHRAKLEAARAATPRGELPSQPQRLQPSHASSSLLLKP